MSDGKTFGQAIREARLAKGMSMGQLAAAVERSTASVQRWERDEGKPAAGVIRDVLAVLELEDEDYVEVRVQPPPVDVGQESISRVSGVTRATSRAAASSSTDPDHPPTGPSGLMARFRDPGRPWLGYVRAGLTVVVLLLLGWVLIWALGGLVDAVGEIWTSLWSGAS